MSSGAIADIHATQLGLECNMRFDDTLSKLVIAALGADAGMEILDTLTIDPAVTGDGDMVSRATVAMALNAVLMHGLLERVPTGAAYVADRRRVGQRITFDHGALRTVRFFDGPTGALPAGEKAFTRILEPLGYRIAGVYPLARLKMTGRAYAHADHAETIPQFFVSELHVEDFSATFHDAAVRVFATSRDPLTAEARTLLERLAAQGAAPLWLAIDGLPSLVAAFGCQHDMPAEADYRLLLAESVEAAWIATEGNAFNHVTDRVCDVDALAVGQSALGRPMKDTVEVSINGRVRQTAFKADPVERRFRAVDGGEISMTVPGSFYEFITRDTLTGANGRPMLDLTFDSGNAQGIFKMTAAA
jgi:hypothetical protein